MSAGRKQISITSFEVASTINRSSMLLQSLSGENTELLKTQILHSGIQNLVSTDMEELFTIAATDKREELNSLYREVTRFGNYCKDPKWHNLYRYFERLSSASAPDWGEPRLTRESAKYVKTKKEVTISVIKLEALAQTTWELYYQLNALDILEKYYHRTLVEMETLQLPRKARGENLIISRSKIKHQRKTVKSLKKKSLWSLSLEEVLGELVDIVIFITEEIFNAFGDKGFESSSGLDRIYQQPIYKPEKLGVAGLALHYAKIITLINDIAFRPMALSNNMRDTLYRWLPTCIKGELQYKLWTVEEEEMLTIPQIKDEMDKTLQWLIPLASNTIKQHQDFRQTRVKESTNRNDIVERTEARDNIMRLETLYHASKIKIDVYIIELLIWLHYMIQEVIGSASWHKGAATVEEYI